MVKIHEVLFTTQQRKHDDSRKQHQSWEYVFGTYNGKKNLRSIENNYHTLRHYANGINNKNKSIIAYKKTINAAWNNAKKDPRIMPLSIRVVPTKANIYAVSNTKWKSRVTTALWSLLAFSGHAEGYLPLVQHIPIGIREKITLAYTPLILATMSSLFFMLWTKPTFRWRIEKLQRMKTQLQDLRVRRSQTNNAQHARTLDAEYVALKSKLEAKIETIFHDAYKLKDMRPILSLLNSK